MAKRATTGVDLDFFDHRLRSPIWARDSRDCKRKQALQDAFDTLLHDDLEGRIIAFDDLAAREAGRVAAAQRRRGRTSEIRDVLIAGVALARKATIATRNIRHFEGLGIELINPWQD